MKTIYWILIAIGALGVAVATTHTAVKKKTVKDEEDVIDETVERLTLGRVYGETDPTTLKDRSNCWICVKYGNNGCKKVKKVKCRNIDASVPHL